MLLFGISQQYPPYPLPQYLVPTSILGFPLLLTAKATLIKENIELRLAYSVRGSVYYYHGWKHGSMKADMMVEKDLRVLHLDSKATRRVWHPRAARKKLSLAMCEASA